jgi:hypothetical protein
MPPPRPDFQATDIVRLKSGKSKILVLAVKYFTCSNRDTIPPRPHERHRNLRAGWYIKFVYWSARNFVETDHKWRIADDFVHYEEIQEVTKKLYQTKDGEFGEFLTRDSQGRMVLEMKGSGVVKAFDKNDIEEVKPYTVKIEHVNGGEVRDYEFKKGSVELGDILLHLSTGRLFRVIQLDSKADGRKTQNGFFKLEGYMVEMNE